MSDSILALDAGTTGVTALLFDRELEPLQRAYVEFPQHFPQPGWVEHEAHEILAAVDHVIDEILATGARPAAIGITNQRETLFALRRDCGEALGAGIVWQDRRTAERCAELRETDALELVRRRTGLVLDPYFSATKAEWMLRERPEVARAARAGQLSFATVDTLLVRHLTRGASFVTDPTNASRTMLFDIDERRWDAELCGLFGVHLSSLPEVRPSTADFGAASLSGDLRVPIHGIAGDQQAALFGQGCFEPGSFKNTYGTGCFLLLNTGARRVRQ